MLRWGQGDYRHRGDLDEYATKLRELCLRDELRQSLAEACMRRVEEYFPERNIPRWQGIFDQL